MKKSEKWTPLKKTKTLGKKKNSTDKNQIKPLGNKNPIFFQKKQTLLPKNQSIKKHMPCEKNLQKKKMQKKKPQLLAKKKIAKKTCKRKTKKSTF